MSQTDSGKDQKAPPAVPSDTKETIGAPDYDPIKSEAQHSLFMDSLDPRLRLAPKDMDRLDQDRHGEDRPGQERLPGEPKASPNPATGRTLDLDHPLNFTDRLPPEGPLHDNLFRDKQGPPNLEQFYEGARDYENGGPLNNGGPINNANAAYRSYYFLNRDKFSGQYYEDKGLDYVFPGFGRFEGKGANNDWRLDYLNGRNCHMKNLGICFRMNIH